MTTTINIPYLTQFAKSIRSLSIDAINAANSGHPGLPLGCAEIGAYLYGHAMNHNPKNPSWFNRDRFILSAGHGSMLLYSCLYLTGYDISLEDIKQFRQLNTPTAGHPEYQEVPGIEATTGPLGQGLAMAAGMALAHKRASEQYDKANTGFADATFYVLAGDGCLMEGISSEVSSLAGHLQLNNLIVMYDSNDICLDGPITDCFTEDVAKRYEAYGWNTYTINGHSFAEIDAAVTQAKASQKPSLIIAKTTIGYGSPNRSGNSESHGKPLGNDESELTKAALDIPLDQLFWVDDTVAAEKSNLMTRLMGLEDTWNQTHSDLQVPKNTPIDLSSFIEEISIKPDLATRASSSAVIQSISTKVPHIIGGSADLSCSDSTYIKQSDHISAQHYTPQNIKYGVREFAMAAMANGIALHGVYYPFMGTFLTFSDYMKNAIRLGALMNLKVIYQLTHDSIFLGEDGPTHQPVEHLASLRSIPNLTVIRPADTTEVKAAWSFALNHTGPVALILTRQGVPDLKYTQIDAVKKGGYVLQREEQKEEGLHHFTLLATGSEVSLALDVATELNQQGKSVRVVSLPSCELFDQQGRHYQDEIIGTPQKIVVIEAQSSFGWHKYIGRDGIAITVDTFGKSAPAKDLKQDYGFTVTQIVERLCTVYTSTLVG